MTRRLMVIMHESHVIRIALNPPRFLENSRKQCRKASIKAERAPSNTDWQHVRKSKAIVAMRVCKRGRITRMVRSTKTRKMHYVPEEPRQGVLIDERFGDTLPQAPRGVFFLVEVYTDEPGMRPHEVEEPEEEQQDPRRVEVQVEELNTAEDQDVDMMDA